MVQNYLPGTDCWCGTWPKSTGTVRPAADGESVSANDWPSGSNKRHFRSSALSSQKAGWNYRIYKPWHSTETKLLPVRIQRQLSACRILELLTSQLLSHSKSANRWGEMPLDPPPSGLWEHALLQSVSVCLPIQVPPWWTFWTGILGPAERCSCPSPDQYQLQNDSFRIVF